jgi:TonB dependent receptor/Carboxypeptidase regulatory-like domain
MEQLLSILVAIGLLATCSFAQDPPAATGTVQGVLFTLDPSGDRSMVPAAQISLDGPTHVETESDGEGEFTISAVPPGSYTISAHGPGISAAGNVAVAAGAISKVALEMKLETVQQSVTVAAGTDSGNPNEAPATNRIGESAVLDAPNVDERFESLLPLVPGVVRGPDGRINLKGTRETQSGMLVDSANASDPATGSPAISVPIDVVSSVQVISNPYDPEYGQLIGAVSSVDTKTGDYEKPHFSIQNLMPRARDRDGHILGIGAFTPRTTVTLPLIKDRLALTQSLEYRSVDTPVNSLPYNARDTKLESFDSYTQLDAIISPKQTATFSFALYPQKLNHVGLNTFTPQASTPDFHQRGYEAYGQDHYAFSEQSILTSQISYRTFDADLTAQSNDPYQLLIDTTQGGFFNRQARNTSRFEWQEVYQAPRWHLLGSHQLKAGINYAHAELSGAETFRPVQIIGTTSATIEQIAFTPGAPFSLSENETAWFVTDEWALNSRLTLSPGLRFDNDSVTSSSHLAPRLGFLLALTKDGKTLLKGGVGVFYGRVPLLLPAFPQMPGRTVTIFDDNGGLESVTPFANRITDRLENPRSTGSNLELDRQLTSALLLRVAYEQRNTARDFVVSPITAGSSGILSLSNAGADSYREFQVTGQYRMRHDLLNASYVRSRAYGDLNDFFQFFGNLPEPVIEPDARARLPFDAPNRFLFWGTIAAPWKFTVSPVYDLHSGFPYSVEDEYREYVGPRNVDRFPRFSSFDLQILRPISLHFGDRRIHARVGGTVFNVFNRDNPRDVQNILASARYGEFFNPAWREFRGKFVLEF